MKITFAVILLFFFVMENNIQKEINRIFLGFTNSENLIEHIHKSNLNFSYQKNNLPLVNDCIEEIWHSPVFKYFYFDNPIESAELTIATYKNKSGLIRNFTTTIKLKFEDSKLAKDSYDQIIHYFNNSGFEISEEIEKGETLGYFKFSEIELNRNQRLLVSLIDSTLFDPVANHYLIIEYYFNN